MFKNGFKIGKESVRAATVLVICLGGCLSTHAQTYFNVFENTSTGYVNVTASCDMKAMLLDGTDGTEVTVRRKEKVFEVLSENDLWLKLEVVDGQGEMHVRKLLPSAYTSNELAVYIGEQEYFYYSACYEIPFEPLMNSLHIALEYGTNQADWTEFCDNIGLNKIEKYGSVFEFDETRSRDDILESLNKSNFSFSLAPIHELMPKHRIAQYFDNTVYVLLKDGTSENTVKQLLSSQDIEKWEILPAKSGPLQQFGVGVVCKLTITKAAYLNYSFLALLHALMENELVLTIETLTNSLPKGD
jgi:hypothetical protein